MADTLLRFRPRARIIRTIGDQLISGPEAAVIELVKNAYDADASRVVITFTPPLRSLEGRITVSDDGHGMTLADIQEKWMEPATSTKAVGRVSPRFRRTMMGSKGIGRFAAAKLGDKLVLRSVSERTGECREIVVGEIDWSRFAGDAYLDDVGIEFLEHLSDADAGTEIEIRSLREPWTREKLERLLLELRRLVSPIDGEREGFKILLDLTACTPQTAGFDGTLLVGGGGAQTTWEAASGEQSEHDPREVRPFPLLTSSDYEIEGSFNGEGRFTGTMQIKRAGQAPEDVVLDVPLLDGEDDCGPVGVRLFVFDREADAVKSNLEKAGLGRLSANEARSIIDNVTGVAVYRDGFRVRPYGDREHDWLTLDSRRVNNPTLRIGFNQVAGYVTVSGQDSELLEKSSREGFEDNAAFRRLRRLIVTLLTERVEPRRLKFREKAGLSRRPSNTSFDEVRQLAELKKLRKFAEGLPVGEREEAVELVDNEALRLADRIAELEERHRVLEAKSSLGAIIAEIIHEGVNEVGLIGQTSTRLQRLWHRIWLNGADRAEAEQEFPGKLDDIRAGSEKLADLFTAIEPLSGGRRNTPPVSFLPTGPINRAIKIFAGSGIPIQFHGARDVPHVIGYPSDLSTAVTNLLKNATHWLKVAATPDPRIDIRFSATVDKVRIDIDDNGPGVVSEFADRIFDPTFSLRDNGTGLGLNIALEALKRSDALLSHDTDFMPGSRFVILMTRSRSK